MIAPLEGGVGLRITALYARPKFIGKAHQALGSPWSSPIDRGRVSP
jgi:hypothetical protein